MLLGAPISKASITPVESWSTPPAFREALQPLPDLGRGAAYVDVAALHVRDLGDVQGDRDDTDARAAHDRIRAARGGRRRARRSTLWSWVATTR